MQPDASPFRPGQPVPAEFFVGRQDAIERLRGLVRAADRGVFKIGFISGERGIGKSSLASFVRHLSEREGAVAGCHVYLGGVHDLHEMARRTFDRLLKDSIDRPWYRHVAQFFGDRVRKVGLFGVSVELALSNDDLRFSQFANLVEFASPRCAGNRSRNAWRCSRDFAEPPPSATHVAFAKVVASGERACQIRVALLNAGRAARKRCSLPGRTRACRRAASGRRPPRG